MLHYVNMNSFQLPVASFEAIFFYWFKLIKNERKFDMKNFKLLLATTAILSMGAMAANAALTWNNYTNAGVNIPLSVRVVDPIKVAVERGINFGTIAHDASDLTKYVAIDKDGKVTATAQYFGGAQTGLVWYKAANDNDGDGTLMAMKMKLVFPTTPVQMNTEGFEDAPCGTVSEFEQKLGLKIQDTNMDYDYPIYIGAKYTSDSLDDHNPGGTSCEGSVTATLVYYTEE